jgi:hypothetical protein
MTETIRTTAEVSTPEETDLRVDETVLRREVVEDRPLERNTGRVIRGKGKNDRREEVQNLCTLYQAIWTTRIAISLSDLSKNASAPHLQDS